MAQKLPDFGALEAKYHKLTEELGNPEILSDRKRYKDVTKEFAHISAVYKLITAVKKTAGDLDQARELLQSDDEELREMARLEVDEAEERLETLQKELHLSLVPPDPNDDRNVILEIRAGTGGNEASLFAGDLYRMYSRYCETHGWKLQILNINPGEVGGYKEVICVIEGDGAYGRLKYESGGHRVQRVPDTEASGRIHTSAVTVAIMAEAEDVEIDIPETDIRIDVFRSSGPGGQSVNTTDSAVRITHLPTGLIVSCQDEKSQHKNRAKALMVLRSRLYEAKQAEIEAERSAFRRQQVGSGDRSEKIRTYNFPQGRVTDHRIGLTLYRLQSFLDGDIDELLDALQVFYKTEDAKAALTA